MKAAPTRWWEAASSGLPQKAHVSVVVSPAAGAAALSAGAAGAAGATGAHAETSMASTMTSSSTPLNRLTFIRFLLMVGLQMANLTEARAAPLQE
jgi:hypothetical protein